MIPETRSTSGKMEDITEMSLEMKAGKEGLQEQIEVGQNEIQHVLNHVETETKNVRQNA